MGVRFRLAKGVAAVVGKGVQVRESVHSVWGFGIGGQGQGYASGSQVLSALLHPCHFTRNSAFPWGWGWRSRLESGLQLGVASWYDRTRIESLGISIALTLMANNSDVNADASQL